MNLTIRSTVASMQHKTDQLSSLVGSSEIENAIEKNDLLDSLKALSLQCGTINNMLTDLETARASLESLGFSQEWFDMVNSDGRFLETINVELTDLLGTDAEKAEVCMEGLMETIWNWIKAAWKWISDMFHKIVQFIAKILGIANSDENETTKAMKLVDLIRNKSDVEDIVSKLGANINTACNRGGKGFDLRYLLERVEVDRAVLTFLGRNISTDYHVKDGDKEILTDEFIDYCRKQKENRTNLNPALINLVNAIVRDPQKLANENPIGFSEFTGVANVTGFRAQMDRVGVTVTEGNVVEFKRAQIEDIIPQIDYSAVYRSAENYATVLDAMIKINKNLRRIESFRKDTIKYIDFLRDAAIKKAEEYSKNNETYSDSVCLQLMARWMSEETNVIGSLVTDMASCMTKARVIRTAITNTLKNVK